MFRIFVLFLFLFLFLLAGCREEIIICDDNNVCISDLFDPIKVREALSK